MAIKIKPMTAGWIVAAVYIFGLLALVFPDTRSVARQLIWPVILFTFIILLCFHKKWNKEFVFSVFLIAFTGFLIEVVGIKTGYVFGYYRYEPVMGYKLWETPLILMAYWFIVIYVTRQVAEMIARDTFLVSVLASGLLLLLDYFMEPFAMKFGLRTWNEGRIPMHNYIGWFVSSIIVQYIYCKSIKMPANKLSLVVYLVMLGFFIGLYLLGK